MEIYQTEEEQVQAIKDWWKKNGRAVITGLIIGLGGIGAYRYWGVHQANQSQQASMIYAEVVAAASGTNSDQAFAKGKLIIDQYKRTPYATLTALTLAQLATQKQDYKTATVQLRWAVENANDDGFAHVARLRLARVLVAENKLDEALSILAPPVAESFSNLFDEARGDVLVLQGKKSEAAAEYQKALLGLEMNPQRKQMLEMKLNDLALTAPDNKEPEAKS